MPDRLMPTVSLEAYATLVDNLDEGVWLLDSRGATLLANRSLLTLLGCGLEELRARRLADVFPDGAASLEALQQAADCSNGCPKVSFEMRYRRADGLQGWVALTAKGLCAPRLTGLLLTLTDVTGRRQQDLQVVALESERGFVQSVIEELPSAVMILDGGNRVRLVNRRALEILQLPEDVVGMDLGGVLPQAVELAAPGRSRQLTIVTLSHRPALIGYSAVPIRIDETGGPATLVVFQELDEVEKLRAELRKQERTATLGRFVAGIAHELRNPLFAISSTCQILTREIDSPLHKQLIGAMSSEVLRVKRLIEDLLSYGNPNPPRFKRASPWQICDEVVTLLKPNAERKGLKLWRAPAPHERAVRLDPERFREVFINLLENALHATQHGEVRVTTFERDGTLVFEVSDTGSGIAPDDVPLVFEPFFSRSHGGTGLGLSIVKKTIEDHGGSVVIAHTQPNGGGTTMEFWIPEA